MKKGTVIKAVKSEKAMVRAIRKVGSSCRFVSLLTRTPVWLRGGNPWGNLWKTSKRVGLINVNFSRSVKRRIAKQLGVELPGVKYKPGVVWYEHLRHGGRSLALVQHKDKRGGLYLQFFGTSREDSYRDDHGLDVKFSKVAPWLVKGKKVEWKPRVVVIKLENVKRLKVGGLGLENKS